MAAATPKTPSDAQPTSENITYEATLNAAASASRFPAGAFLDYAGLKKILEALAEMYATGDRAAEGLAYASLATTGRDAAAAVKRAPSSFQVSSHEAFLEKLDGELAKCDDFAHREVVKVKRELAELESGGSRPRSGSLDGDPEEVEGWRVDAVGQHFLEVEKYVNVNVTAQRETCFGRDTDVRGGMQKPLVRQKLEPKLIFATERTFVHWLHASVVFLTFGAGAMAVADGAAGTAAERSRAWVVALVLSAGSIAINIFALYNYKWRLGRIRSREPVEWGDPRGPAVLGSILIALLSLSLVLNTRRLMAGEI